MSEASPEASSKDWSRALVDPAAFEAEQEALKYVWTLVGWTRDLRNDGDWIRGQVGLRSVFIQRFGDELRGFENRCAHRFFPLRTADKGNGPVVCGFHHWRYDRDGRALGIPMAQQMYGKTPREIDARLTPLDVATCGQLVFARFRRDGETDETLESFLAGAFPILAHVCNPQAAIHPSGSTIAANWRLNIHISLDDYHVVAVHPTSFGKGGYLKPIDYRYVRFGAHSAHFTGNDPETLESIAIDCAKGRYVPPAYRIFNIFPNTLVVVVRAWPDWYAFVQQFVPLACDRSQMRAWFFPLPNPRELSLVDRIKATVVEPVRARLVRRYAGRVNGEDAEACERLQSAAREGLPRPILANQEERIGWFEETYAKMTSATARGA